MKIGWSILEQHYIPADAINTGDCIKFQVVCPSCREAVFKVDRAGGDRRYLAHYRRNKALNAECELRVKAISNQTIQQKNSESRGQHLDLFMSVLRRELFKVAGDKASKVNIDHMLIRPSYRALVRNIRVQVTGGYKEELWQYVEKFYANRSAYWRERQFTYARDVLEHLLAPNSFQIFAFGISIGGVVGTVDSLDDPRISTMVKSLLLGSERDLRRLLERYGRATIEHITVAWVTVLMELLAHIPYIDLLAKQHGIADFRALIDLISGHMGEIDDRHETAP